VRGGDDRYDGWAASLVPVLPGRAGGVMLKKTSRGEGEMGYQPIEDYGVIGDLHTVALVGKDGSIDFLSFPGFDSPTVFAALLDETRGGWFRIAPRLAGSAGKQLYLPDTNVLITRWLSGPGWSRSRISCRSGTTGRSILGCWCGG
jgi:hypothetical protein